MGLHAPRFLVVSALTLVPHGVWAQEPQRAAAPPAPLPPPQAPESSAAQGPQAPPPQGQPPPPYPPQQGPYAPGPGSSPPGQQGMHAGPGYPQQGQPQPNAYPSAPQDAVALEPMTPKPDPDEGPRPLATITMGVFYYQLFGAGFGGTIGVHVLPRTIIEVDAYRASSLVPDELSDSLAVRVQQILDEHFYVRGGLRYRVIEQKKVLDFDDYEERYRQRDLGIDFAAGSRWDRGHLVLGIDIAGIYMPFEAFFAEEQTLDTSNDELLAADEQDIRLLVDVRLAYLYIGARF